MLEEMESHMAILKGTGEVKRQTAVLAVEHILDKVVLG